jgi:hypothetical protein
MLNAYNVCEGFLYLFAAAVMAHTLLVLQMGGAAAVTASTDAFQMAQDLVHYRAAITGGLIALYLYLRISKRPVAKVLAIVSVISWIAFIEDYLALDNIFFVSDSITGLTVQTLRPIYLVSIVYLAVEAFRRENRHG